MGATNISPIEIWEEGTYNLLTIVSISGLIGSILLVTHLMIFHSIFSYLYLTLGVVFLGGSTLFPYLKSNRFGEKNMSLAERIVVLEQGILGVSIA